MLNHWLIPHQKTATLNDFSSTPHKGIIEVDSLENCNFPAICLIGTDEKTAQPIKDEFLGLPLDSFTIPIYDLGILWNQNEEDLRELMCLIIKQNLTPIFFGEKSKVFSQMFQALENVLSPFNFSICESIIGKPTSFISQENNPFHNQNLIQGSIIGFQSHLSQLSQISEELGDRVELLRLGILKNNMDLAEALIRNSDGFCFNLNAIRYSDFPAQIKPNSCGISAEEACQLLYYAGNNEKLKACSLAGIAIDFDDRNVSAHLIAQMIWYFVEGFQKRKYTFSYPGWEKDTLIEYVVDIKDWENPLTFLKSQTTNKWWFKLPDNDLPGQDRHSLIACTYNEYDQSILGNVPDRIIKALKLYDLKLQL